MTVSSIPMGKQVDEHIQILSKKSKLGKLNMKTVDLFNQKSNDTSRPIAVDGGTFLIFCKQR